MKKVILIIVVIFFFSCEEKKIEFIESKATKSLVLVKNYPKNIDETKTKIIEYIKEQKKEGFLEFYEYSSNTKPFIEQERVGGYFREYIEYYQDENGICALYTPKCKEDTLKQISIVRYYQKYGNFYEPDTIFGNCK